MLKLNNRGWGLGSIIAGIGVFAIALLIVVILVHNGVKELEPNYDKNSDLDNEYNENNNSHNQQYDYRALENKIVVAAKEYANQKYSDDFDEDTLVTVTVKKLQKENLLDSIYDLKDKRKNCSGYVSFSKKNSKFNFQPFLKCNQNYETDGYEERFDDK